MTARFADHILAADVLANRPAASSVPVGALYPATDSGIIYQSNGTTWATWRPAAEALPLGGTTGQVLTKQSPTDGDADWADPTGGGGGTSELLKPATPTDDFPGSSLTGWSLAGGYTSGDYTVHDGLLEVTVQRGQGSYFYQAPPASDFTLTMKATLIHDGGNLMAGLMALDTSGNGIAVGFYTGQDGVLTCGVSGGSYDGSFNGKAGPKGSIVASGLPAWYRLRKSGTSYYGSMSLNGLTWSTETAAKTHSATIARVGFGTWFGNLQQAAVEWFHAA